MSEEVDGHDRARALRDRRLHAGGIELVRGGIDVGEDRRGTNRRDRFRRGVEGIGGADHLSVRTNVVGPEREDQRVGSVCHPHGVRDAEIGSRLRLERLDVGTEDKHPAADHLSRSLGESCVERRPLAAEIHQWYAHGLYDTGGAGSGR